jgi:ATP-dependent DNA helicase RecQ
MQSFVTYYYDKGYQLPPLVNGSPTIVISPLIALMEDQVLALREKGIPAGFLQSDMKEKEKYALVYASPEKLENSMHVVERIYRKSGITCFAIDECHCISEWGHDFRSSYRKLSMLRDRFPNVPIIALTATATEKTIQDVVTSLKLNQPKIIRTSFNRANLFYEIRIKKGLARDLTAEEIGNESAIVYCMTKNEADEIARHLKKLGISAEAYHSACTDANRSKVHHAFVRDELQVVVATIAFGMGVDKPVRFIVVVCIQHWFTFNRIFAKLFIMEYPKAWKRITSKRVEQEEMALQVFAHCSGIQKILI